MTFVAIDPTIGNIDISVLASATLGSPGPSDLPSFVAQTQLGQITKAWDPTLGGAEFIYLQIPASTAFPLGTVVVWDAAGGATAGGYVATIAPVGGTMKATGQSVAVTLFAIASNTSVQYGWFQIQGVASVLKTAVTVSPATAVYFSGTTGRITNVSSTGKQILGARVASTATVTSTTSTVLVYIDRPRAEGA